MPFNPAPLGTDLTLFSPTTGLPKKQQVDPKILALREQYSNPTYKMTEEEALEYATGMGMSDSARGIGQIFAKATGWDNLDEKLKEKDKKLHAVFQNEEFGGKAFAAFLGSAVVLDPVSYVPVVGWAKKAKNAKTLWEFTKYGSKAGAILGGIGYTSEDIPGIITDAEDDFLKKKIEQVGISTVAGGTLSGVGGLVAEGVQKLRGKPRVFATKTKTDTSENLRKTIEGEKVTPKPTNATPLNDLYRKYGGDWLWSRVKANPAETLGITGGGLTGYRTTDSVLDEYGNVDEEATRQQALTNTFIGIMIGYGTIRGSKYLDKDKIIRQKIGRALISDYGLTVDRIAARQDFIATKNRIGAKFGEIAERAYKELNADELTIMYRFMVGELESLEGVANAKLIRELSKESRDLITKYGQEFVDKGLLDIRTFKRNIDTYLKRSYLKHRKEGTLTSRVYESNKDIRLIGDELKPRGITDTTTVSAFNKKDSKWGSEGWRVVEELKGNISPKAWAKVPDSKKKIRVRRDYTKEERLEMEEIENASFALAETGRLFANDIATARFFDDLAADSRYVLNEEKWLGLDETARLRFEKLPETVIEKTRVKKYGQLSGMYVEKNVARDIKHIFKLGRDDDFYRQAAIKEAIWLQKLWKKTKTSYNPGTHVANSLSNIMLIDVGANTEFKYVLKAMREMKKGDKSELYKAAKIDGIFDSNIVTKELNEHGTIIEKGLIDLQRSMGHVESGIWGWTKAKGKWLGNYTLDQMERAYAFEDSVFRMAVYMDRIDKGLGKNTAALDARKWFVDYDINAPVIKGLKNTVVPFISYTYRVIPLLAESAVLRPHKIAKWAAIAVVANEIGEMATDDDSEINERTMRESYRKPLFGLDFMPSTNIRMPFNSRNGDPMYLNVSRWTPGGDIFELKNPESSQLPGIPQPLQPGGLFVDAWSNFYSKTDPFTGDKIEGKGKDQLIHFLKRLPPNIPGLPGTFATAKLEKAKLFEEGKEGTQPSPYTAPLTSWVAIANGVGIKLNPQSEVINKEGQAYDYQLKAGKLENDIKKLQSDYDNQKGNITVEEKEKIEQELMEELIKVSAEYQLLLDEIRAEEAIVSGKFYRRHFVPQREDKFVNPLIPIRIGKFKGGEISEDYPVPNASPIPSERVDKNTGLPYDSEMERLGFKRLGFKSGNIVEEAVKVFNNPGNIERGQGFAGETGEYYGKKNRFVVFDSPEAGIRAIMRDLRTKVRDHNGDLRAIINKYAPSVENPTKNYYKYLQQTLGKDKVTIEDIPQLTKGIIEFENKPTEDMPDQKRLEAQGRLDKYLSPEIFNMAQRISQYDYPTGTTSEQMREDLETGVWRTQ